MKTKTIIVIILTALLTIFLMTNAESVEFNFLIGSPVKVSKLLVIGLCILIGFILGFIAGRPRKTYSSYDNEIERKQKLKMPQNPGQQLSDEDKEYIS